MELPWTCRCYGKTVTCRDWVRESPVIDTSWFQVIVFACGPTPNGDDLVWRRLACTWGFWAMFDRRECEMESASNWCVVIEVEMLLNVSHP